jgi:hypothetical protein
MLIDGPPVSTPERAPGPTPELDSPASVLTDYIAPAPARHLPHMLLATTLVAVLPLAVSLALRATGVISGWVSVGLAVAMSMAASTAGSTYWRKRHGAPATATAPQATAADSILRGSRRVQTAARLVLRSGPFASV